jgi:serine/threonine protein kinase/tetratricopeptide (TPR) repeat protein
MQAASRSLKELFLAALEVAPPGRAAWLQRECPDVDLRERLAYMLAAHDAPNSLLDAPAGSLARTVDDPITERPGTIIGPYKLLEQIGEGGFGVVFMAEQSQPVRRRVALKVLKPGMDTRQVVARFEAERQALAIMDHPNIAKVHDGGATSSGRPYFVMELVKGAPITAFCDQNQLTTRGRLELFISMCKAVQHAHQKGIIHRDLKPSNVLVTVHDTTPVVKVIDFGVAKALGQELTDKTLFTGFAQMIGTPLYMSPEQAGQSGLDIDTRSDIYSLGVLLYELLTGTTPFTKERFKEAAYDEIRRIIREEEPPSPSTRLSSSKDSLPSISELRHTEPAKLTRLVRGELDWIVMKALEKDRSRRYETASAMAADVDRYLRDLPVSAGPPGAAYRLRKFVRRNRGPVLAASLVLLALVVGVIGTTIGLLGTEKARQTAQRRLEQIEKANEILGSLFKDLNLEAAEHRGTPLEALLGERLDQATAQLEGEAIGDPLAVARMQITLGESQLGLGFPEKAIILFIKSRTAFTTQLGDDSPETLMSMHDLAWAYLAASKFDLALPLYQETLERRKAKLGPDHPDTLQTMNNLALGYGDIGRLDLALLLYQKTFELRKAKLGLDHADTLQSMSNLGMGYLAAHKHDMALPLLEDAVTRNRATRGSDHSLTLIAMNNLAGGYQEAGKLDLALPLFEETLSDRQKKLGPNHPYTLQSMNNLALAYQDVGKLELALPLYEATLQQRKARLPPGHREVIQSMNNLAWGCLEAGKLDRAVPLYEDTLKLMMEILPRGHPNTLTTMNSLGMCYIRSGQHAKAEPLLRECLAIRARREADSWRTFATTSLLGAALAGQKRYPEAELLLLSGYQGMKKHEAQIPNPHKIRLIEALERLVQFYESTTNKDKANEWRKKLTEAKAAGK